MLNINEIFCESNVQDSLDEVFSSLDLDDLNLVERHLSHPVDYNQDYSSPSKKEPEDEVEEKELREELKCKFSEENSESVRDDSPAVHTSTEPSFEVEITEDCNSPVVTDTKITLKLVSSLYSLKATKFPISPQREIWIRKTFWV